MKKLFMLIPIVAAALLSSCGNTGGGGGGGGSAAEARYNAYDRPTSKPTNRSNVSVKVSLKNQMAYVMEGSKPLLIMPVSVGTASTPTPTGNFRIYSKTPKRRAYTHGFAVKNGAISMYKAGKSAPAGAKKIGTPMPYWNEFKPAYGMHTGWLKPFPCTHGCIRMHKNLAPKFNAIVPVGAKLNISYSQAEDATIGRNIPRPPDASPFPNTPASLSISDKIFSSHKSPKYN